MAGRHYNTDVKIRIKLQVFGSEVKNNKNYNYSNTVIEKLSGNCME